MQPCGNPSALGRLLHGAPNAPGVLRLDLQVQHQSHAGEDGEDYETRVSQGSSLNVEGTGQYELARFAFRAWPYLTLTIKQTIQS